MADEPKVLDLLRDGVKVGDVPDSVPVIFKDDKDCADFLNKLNNLEGLPDKYRLTIESCLTVLSSENDTEMDFGPLQILRMAELSFRYPAEGSMIMSAVQYLLGYIDFVGELPPNIFADLGSAYGLLGSIINKSEDDSDDLYDDEEFGYNLGEDSEDE